MTEGYSGKKGLSTSTSHFNVLAFIFQQLLGEFRTVTLARVEAVHASDGSDSTPGTIAPSGFVDVTPLVNQVDGTGGNPQEHGMVFGLPYFRLQGGKNAIILDPEKGDIGIIAIADRDISSVKANKDQANPGSFRRGSFADGLYLGGFLNDKPEQYITFTDKGIEIHDKNGNDITTSSQGVTITDANQNTIITNAQGVVIEDNEENIVTMSAAGITLTSPTGVTLSTPTTYVPGNLVVDGVVTGKTPTTALVVNSPVKVNNTLEVTQAITADSTITATGEVKSGTIPLSTHHHTGVTTGAGNTGGPAP